MAEGKGIVLNLLCTNPSCSFSEKKLEVKEALSITKSSGKCSFDVPKACPKCKSAIELIDFVSGSVQIKADR